MLNVQMSAMVAADGYQSQPLRTGYEQVIGSRASNDFAYTFDGEGKVESISDTEIVIVKKDGEKVGIKLGTNHVDTAGVTIPHEIVTDLKVGDKVKSGDIVTWENGWFERDWMNPRNVTMKTGALARVALLENNGTLEDSSLVSQALADRLSTNNSKRKMIVVDFGKNVHKLGKVGDDVDLDSVLCLIEDASVSTGDLTDDQVKALSRFGANTPKAKFTGKISKVEVFYNGQQADMSETLKKIVKDDNRRRAKEAKALGVDSVTGEIFEEGFVYSEKIERNQVGIAIYMDSSLEAGIGDKAVVAAQLKTIFGGIMPAENRTLSGDSIDLIFGRNSVMNRIVESVEIMGIVNSVNTEITRQAYEDYFRE